MRGRFITLEGGEGTGKSTQGGLLAAALRRIGCAVIETREPGGSPTAEALRTVLLSGAVKAHGPLAEAMVFAAARDDHLETRIRPALERGTWVICDRFLDSTRVYQGTLGGVEPATLEALERTIVGPTAPDLTLVLDLDPKIGLARAALRRAVVGDAPDRFEQEALDWHRRVREAFQRIAAAEPERCALIDASRGVNEVALDIWSEVSRRLAPEGRAPSHPDPSARP